VNSFDVVLLVLLAASTALGLRNGFVVEVAGIFGSVLAFGVARLEYGDVGAELQRFLSRSPWMKIVAYFIVFFIMWTAVMIVARRMRSLLRLMMLGWLDRIGGAIIGFAQGVLVAVLVVYLASRSPGLGLRQLERHSALGHVLVSAAPVFTHLFPTVPR
jgi:membrane protein required for colicin V production